MALAELAEDAVCAKTVGVRGSWQTRPCGRKAIGIAFPGAVPVCRLHYNRHKKQMGGS